MTTTKRQIKANRKRWVKALLSGEYRQGMKYLCNDGKFCCLGVAHHILLKEEPPCYWSGASEEATVIEPLGLGEEDCKCLVRMNDGGKRFTTIAKYIEQLPIPETAL